MSNDSNMVCIIYVYNETCIQMTFSETPQFDISVSSSSQRIKTVKGLIIQGRLGLLKVRLFKVLFHSKCIKYSR